MRDLQKYAKVCMSELDALNIKYGKIKRFMVCTKSKRIWGTCDKLSDGYIISINAYLLKEDCINEKGLKNTIIHELLHSCDGCMNHGKKWKMLAALVNEKYGYNISRSNSMSEKDMVGTDYESSFKHKIVCIGCQTTWYRTRTTKLITNTSNYRCGLCGGELRVLY